MKVIPHFLLWRVGLAKPWTYYSEKSCETLSRYAVGKKCLAEIGCWQGVNTARLRKAMSSVGILYAVDPYEPGRFGFSAAEVIAHAELKKIRNGKLKWMKMSDLEAARTLARKHVELDFIFSDSRNDYEGFKRTWEAWNPLLAPDGIYILANSRMETDRGGVEPGSVRFTREVILKDPRFRHREAVESFTILQKRLR